MPIPVTTDGTSTILVFCNDWNLRSICEDLRPKVISCPADLKSGANGNLLCYIKGPDNTSSELIQLKIICGTMIETLIIPRVSETDGAGHINNTNLVRGWPERNISLTYT